MIKLREARSQERLAFEGAFHIHEAITLPLIDEAFTTGVWHDDRRQTAFQQMIGFYERVGKMFAPDEHQLEVVAMASRRSGALRMVIADDSAVRTDYERAIEIYEALSKKTPQAIWYRTSLISVLREVAAGSPREKATVKQPRRAATARTKSQAGWLTIGIPLPSVSDRKSSSNSRPSSKCSRTAATMPPRRLQIA